MQFGGVLARLEWERDSFWIYTHYLHHLFQIQCGKQRRPLALRCTNPTPAQSAPLVGW